MIVLWVLRRLGFVGETAVCDNGRFAYVKLTGAGNLRLPCGFWEIGHCGENGRFVWKADWGEESEIALWILGNLVL